MGTAYYLMCSSYLRLVLIGKDGGEQGQASSFLREYSRVKPDASTQRRRRVVDDDEDDDDDEGGVEEDPYDEYEREFGNNNHRVDVVVDMPHKTVRH